MAKASRVAARQIKAIDTLVEKVETLETTIKRLERKVNGLVKLLEAARQTEADPGQQTKTIEGLSEKIYALTDKVSDLIEENVNAPKIDVQIEADPTKAPVPK